MIRVLLFFIICIRLFAQNDRINAVDQETDYPDRIGIVLGMNYNLHSADFQNYPNIPDCCSKYTGGNAVGLALGLVYIYPFDESLGLRVIATYDDFSSLFEETNAGGNVVQGQNGNAFTGTYISRFTGDNSLSAVSFNFAPYYKVDDLYLNLGLKSSYLLSATADIKEEISSPGDIVFASGPDSNRRIRGERSFDIENTNNFQFFINPSIAYKFPISKKIDAFPEIGYNIAITNVIDNWKANHLFAGVSMTYKLVKEKPLPIIRDTLIYRDTIYKEIAGLKEIKTKLVDEDFNEEEIEYSDRIFVSSTISEYYETDIPFDYNFQVDLIGSILDNPKIIIEELESFNFYSILPQVFFEVNSSELISGYQLSNSPVLDSNQITSSYVASTKVLDIIGQRMVKNSQAKITLTGCNDGEEARGLDLSEERALEVKSYLTKVWGIDSERILIQKRNLPAFACRNDSEEAKQENRRVEISSESPVILSPFIIREIEVESNPPRVDLRPELKEFYTKDGIQYKISISQDGNPIRYWKATDESTLEWIITEEPMPRLDAPVTISVIANDKYGKESVLQKEINVEQLTIKKKRQNRIKDQIIEKFTVLGYVCNDYRLNQGQRDILGRAKSEIQKDSQLRFEVFTDKTGDYSYNKNLANSRLETVLEDLNKNKDQVQFTINEPGNTPFENDTPIGRSLSRAVEITIINPTSN